MAAPLWTFVDLAAAASGSCDGVAPAEIAGFSIDTRSIQPGEVFVALTDQRDGHAFVTSAFKAGAAIAIVRGEYARQPGDGALLRVDDPLRALEHIGIAARTRLDAKARIVAVTGSAGKTGTKEMLRVALATAGRTHAAIKSFNNHWGVPLTLASMPADTMFGVFEIGMNHAGEITPLTRFVRPHVAVITNVLPVHIGNFPDGEAGVAAAKAEIFAGLEPAGIAIIPEDSEYVTRLRAHVPAGRRIVTFGTGAGADVRAGALEPADAGTSVEVLLGGRTISYRCGLPGLHIAVNSLAVVAVLDALGVPLAAALAPLAGLAPPDGRGARSRVALPSGTATLIDESYNANPASMRAALAVLVASVPKRAGRRIAVLGDMRELGKSGPELHRALIDAIDGRPIDQVFTCGLLMRNLFEVLPPQQRAAWSDTSTGLIAALLAGLRDGDVIMVKGSLGTNMAPIVAELKKRGAAASATL